MNVGLCFGESCLFKSEQVSKLRDCWDTPQQLDIGQADIYIYIYIYSTPQKNLCSPHFCWYLQYFVSIFGGLLDLSFWGTIYIFCARRLHDLFVHFGGNAFRMHSMHSECILGQNQDPRFPQDSWLKS